MDLDQVTPKPSRATCITINCHMDEIWWPEGDDGGQSCGDNPLQDLGEGIGQKNPQEEPSWPLRSWLMSLDRGSGPIRTSALFSDGELYEASPLGRMFKAVVDVDTVMSAHRGLGVL